MKRLISILATLYFLCTSTSIWAQGESEALDFF